VAETAFFAAAVILTSSAVTGYIRANAANVGMVGRLGGMPHERIPLADLARRLTNVVSSCAEPREAGVVAIYGDLAEGRKQCAQMRCTSVRKRMDSARETLCGDASWSVHDFPNALDHWAQAGDYRRLWEGGVALRREGLWTESAAVFKAAIAMRPDDWHAYGLFGSVLWDHGDLKGAAAVYESMIERRLPNMGDGPFASLGLIYADESRCDLALQTVEKGSNAPKPSAAMLTAKGVVLARCGKPAEAVSILRSALAEKPESRDACYWLGWSYARLFDDQSAVAQFTDCIRRHPDDISSRYELGMANIRQNHREIAHEQFAEILRIKAGWQPAIDRWQETRQETRARSR
jgi:tetratricopeptide (TPR) repeat protein